MQYVRWKMFIDVSALLRGEINKINIDFTLSPETIEGVSFPEGARVTGTLTDNAGFMRLTLTAKLAYLTECARCLAPVAGQAEIAFERTAVTEGTLTEQQLEDNVDEYVVINGAYLDIDTELKEEISMSFPQKILCSEDCPGLCPMCGKKLEGDVCSCGKKETDPRFDILKTLINKKTDE